MTELLSRLFIKNRNDTSSPVVRAAYGAMAGIVGIVLNLLLFAAKFTVGTLCASVSIVADAWNNLSDAGSSLISLVTFRIAAKPADRDHPFGHARIEYVASMIVSFLILLIGYELFSESLSKVLHPTETIFSIASVAVLGLSILVKLWMALFNRRLGRKINSEVLKATSVDSLSDALATTAVLISTLIFRFTSFDTDGYMGIIVAVVIFIAGVKILNETKNSILGQAPDPALVDNIRQLVESCPDALGLHDLLVHNYGAGMTIASLHVEVDGSRDIFELHDSIDSLEKKLSEDLNILCTIHMDPIVTDNEQINALQEKVNKAVARVDERLKIHDFRFVAGQTHSNLIFDVAVPFELKLTDEEVRQAVAREVKTINENYCTVLTIDRI